LLLVRKDIAKALYGSTNHLLLENAMSKKKDKKKDEKKKVSKKKEVKKDKKKKDKKKKK